MHEPEWDSGDSSRYHDGREQAEADRRDRGPFDDRAGVEVAAWTEGYRDGWEDTDG